MHISAISATSADLLAKNIVLPFPDGDLELTVRPTELSKPVVRITLARISAGTLFEDLVNPATMDDAELARMSEKDYELLAEAFEAEVTDRAAAAVRTVFLQVVTDWSGEDDNGPIPLTDAALAERVPVENLAVILQRTMQELAGSPKVTSKSSKPSTKRAKKRR